MTDLEQLDGLSDVLEGAPADRRERRPAIAVGALTDRVGDEELGPVGLRRNAGGDVGGGPE